MLQQEDGRCAFVKHVDEAILLALEMSGTSTIKGSGVKRAGK